MSEKMVKVGLFYRDGSNYKCNWSVLVAESLIEGMEVGSEIEVGHIGLNIEDIPLVKEYGYDDDVDHPFVKITKIGGSDETVPIGAVG